MAGRGRGREGSVIGNDWKWWKLIGWLVTIQLPTLQAQATQPHARKCTTVHLGVDACGGAER